MGPDFVCFGLQKGGTRWLYDQMRSRPDVWMPPIKEMNFFAGTALKPVNLKKIQSLEGQNDPFIKMFADYENHVGDVEWYKSLFQFKGDRLSGDISPVYARLTDEEVEWVAGELTATKFIFLVREPVSRLWSAICMDVRKGLIDPAKLQDVSYVKSVAADKLVKSLPSVIWERWRQYISRERMAFWFLDDIRERPEEVVDEICEFIGAQTGPGGLPADHNTKAGSLKVPMNPKVKSYLVEFFREEYERCAEMFGGHALRWREAALGASA